MVDNFKQIHRLDEREAESTRIRTKYPDRIPIILNKDPKCKLIKDIDRKKYLVPNDLTVGQFVFVIRKRIKLSPETAIYLFVNNSTIPTTSSTISSLYDSYKDIDGFLYITYSSENTFG